MRADGLAATTIARRVAAVASSSAIRCSSARARTTRPPSIVLPRRPRTLPRTLSPAESERLIDAAIGVTPRAMRDRALVELLYGAGLRVSEALGLARRPSTSTPASCACSARATRSGSSRSAARPSRPSAATSRSGAHTSTAATGPTSSSTRAAAPSPRRRLPDPPQAGRAGRARARARPPAPAPPLVRDPPARGRRRPPLRPGDARARRPRRRPSATRMSPTATGGRPTSPPTRMPGGRPATTAAPEP